MRSDAKLVRGVQADAVRQIHANHRNLGYTVVVEPGVSIGRSGRKVDGEPAVERERRQGCSRLLFGTDAENARSISMRRTLNLGPQFHRRLCECAPDQL